MSSSLKRRTPLRRKAAHRGRPKRAECQVRGCHRRPYVGGERCITHAKAEADRLFSLYIRERDGACTRCGSTQALQCSHHVSRARLATRYDPWNATTHCAACHKLLTEHPQLHVEWIQDHIGPEAYGWLLDRAYGPRDADGRRHQTETVRPDYGALIALYRGRDAA